MEDMHIFGAILYTGDDHTAHAASCVFGGSDVIRDLAEANKLNIKRHLNNVLALIR
jgi:hypothetical protein